MKSISDRDYDTIVRAARVLQGMRHSDAAIANALRHIVAVGRKWARKAQKRPLAVFLCSNDTQHHPRE